MNAEATFNRAKAQQRHEANTVIWVGQELGGVDKVDGEL